MKSLRIAHQRRARARATVARSSTRRRGVVLDQAYLESTATTTRRSRGASPRHTRRAGDKTTATWSVEAVSPHLAAMASSRAPHACDARRRRRRAARPATPTPIAVTRRLAGGTRRAYRACISSTATSSPSVAPARCSGVGWADVERGGCAAAIRRSCGLAPPWRRRRGPRSSSSRARRRSWPRGRGSPRTRVQLGASTSFGEAPRVVEAAARTNVVDAFGAARSRRARRSRSTSRLLQSDKLQVHQVVKGAAEHKKRGAEVPRPVGQWDPLQRYRPRVTISARTSRSSTSRTVNPPPSRRPPAGRATSSRPWPPTTSDAACASPLLHRRVAHEPRHRALRAQGPQRRGAARNASDSPVSRR